MTIATVKTAKRTDKGGWSITTNEHAQSFLCMDKDYQFRLGEKVEFAAEERESAKGNKWYLMKNPKSPEQKVNGGTFGPQGRGNEWSIFVTGIVGRAMGSGKFAATDIKGLTLAALEAWYEVDERHRNLVTAKPVPTAQTIGDEVSW